MLEPIGAQAQLNCRVQSGYRVVWRIILDDIGNVDITDPATANAFRRKRGVITELSTPKNPEHPLFINGTMGNNQTISMVRCIAVNHSDLLDRCLGMLLSVIFYGK